MANNTVAGWLMVFCLWIIVYCFWSRLWAKSLELNQVIKRRAFNAQIQLGMSVLTRLYFSMLILFTPALSTFSTPV